MTTTLERPAASPSVAPSSRPVRWWSQWRVALRLARRDAWRSKGRSLLVVLLIALPVAVVTGVYVDSSVSFGQYSDRTRIHALVGDTAQAYLLPVGGSVYQAPNGRLGNADGTEMIIGDDKNPRPTTVPSQQQLLAALPAGSRIVSAGTVARTIIENGAWGVAADVEISDVTDPLPAGRWDVVEGVLPRTAQEIALTPDAARRLHVSVGDAVRITDITTRADASLRVAGVVRPIASGWNAVSAVALPSALHVPAPDASSGFLASVPGPLTWADVRAVNRAGGAVESLAVLDSPPAFCRVDRICFDDHGASIPREEMQPISTEDAAELARKAAEGAVIVVLVVMQIALLAGPAFAVQLRRRQRELGLVSASGGQAGVLRRTMLASGVVLGLVGAGLGLALGYGVVLLLGGVLPWAPLADQNGGARLGAPPFPRELLGFALVGAVSALAAAFVPAVTAGRGDVIDALKGQRPLPALRRRTPVLGVVMAGVGLAITAYGVTRTDALVLGVGVVIGELGLVLLMPWLVVQLGRPARALPVSLRLAVRDSGRHRMRTAAAACAVMAAAAAAVAVSAWALSSEVVRGSSERNVPEGVVVSQVQAPTNDNGAPTAPVSSVLAPARRAVADVVPGVTTVVRNLVPAGPTTAGVGQVQCVPWPTWTPSRVSADGVALDQPCTGRVASGGSVLYGPLLVDDPEQLDLLLGPLAPLDQAKAALRQGEALVLTPHSLDPQGRVWLEGLKPDGTALEPMPVPGMEVLTGAFPAQVIVGPAALATAPLTGRIVADPTAAYLLVKPTTPDRPDEPTTADRITVAFAKQDVAGGVLDPGTSYDPVVLSLALGAAATLLLALLAGLMVTALALADGRGDMQTLAAVGGPPRVRRRFAASSAGFVTGLGCWVGAFSGLVVAWVLLPLFGSTDATGRLVRGPFAVPCATLALVVLAVPGVTAAVAWATTRSRITLTRRPD